MKKVLNILLVASLVVALPSCKDEEPAVNLTLNNNTVTLNLNSVTLTATVTIESGNGGYDAESSDKAVAVASVSGKTVTITAVGEGTSTVIVADGKGKTASIAVTVKYEIPSSATFSWNGASIEFDKAGGYGISILSNSIALTDLNIAKKQYVVSWTGGLSEGEKSNGKLEITEQGKTTPETIMLTSIKVVQAGTSGNYLVFSDGNNSGDLFYEN